MTVPVTSSRTAVFGPEHRGEAQGQRSLPRLSKVLHWLTAALVLLMLISGVLMKQLGGTAISDALYTLHKTSGMTILALVLLRLGYRLAVTIRGRWPSAAGEHPVHVALYAGLILVPLLGWAGVSDYNARELIFGLSLPAILPQGGNHADWLLLSHGLLAFCLFGLVLVHIGIALNQYIQREGHRS